MIMNKKVSTLVAALMAAGALVLPKDVFAQVAYANGDYDAQTSIETPTNENTNCFIVFNEGGTDYVAVVDPATNGLIAKDFASATLDDLLTFEYNSNKDAFWIKNWGADNSGYLKFNQEEMTQFGGGTVKSVKIQFKDEQIKINSTGNNGYVTRTGTTFAVNTGAKADNPGFYAKAVSVSALKTLTVPGLSAMSNTEEVSNGDAVILMYGNQVLTWDADIKDIALVNYDEDEPALWYLEIDAVKKTARFKDANKNYLLNEDGSDYITVNLTSVSGKTGVYTATWTGIGAGNIGSLVPNGLSAAAIPERPITSVGDLNTWYNGKGFNFAVKGSNVEGNLFGSDKVIFSFTVQGLGYTLVSQGANPITIPAGTYFFTDVKFLEGKGAADVVTNAFNSNAGYIDWLNSTLIAVSSTVASEATDSDRKQGEGFELVEVLGSNFDFQEDGDDPQGADISINNAAFTITKQAGNDYPYALSLDNFTYQTKATNYDTEKQETKPIKLAVESYTNSGTTTSRIVSQVSSTNSFIFKFGNSAVLNVRTLLKDTKEAAVYTIQFVDGAEADEKLMDKYLTVGLNTDYNNFQFEAKPEAIFDASLPIFQWTITSVSDGEKNADGEMEYKTATFTNRETGETITTKLFNEGDGLYSMDIEDLTVAPFSIEEKAAQNTYAVKEEASRTINSNVIIKLNPVTVDEYAGFLNVDDETIRTIAFARDKYTTSNRLFASVVTDGTTKSLNEDDEFVNELVDAAQWQLLKVEQDSISRTFVYNNTVTKSADRVANGDKVKAYVYAFQLIEDGSETGYFLKNNYTNYSFGNRDLVKYSDINESADMKTKTSCLFLIKENVDGSVSLITYTGSTMAESKVARPETSKAIDATYDDTNKEYEYAFHTEKVYQSEVESNEVRVYLDNEYSEISWPANEGHVTLLSEMDNYITKNSDNDAIEVAETDPNVYYLHVTDKNAVVPSFYISLGAKENNTAETERLYMFNPVDSVDYYVADGTYDKKYQWSEEETKLIFKSATMGESRDTLTTTIKGEEKQVAMKADNNSKNILGGLQRFKFQIVETEDGDGEYYYIRQLKADKGQTSTLYLTSRNSKMTFDDKTKAMKFHIESVAAPTANEAISATDVKVIALDGAVNVKNAAGKNVVVSTILGQIVANEVLTSDNATISVPAGIAIVSVDGEEAVKVSVK